MFKPSPSYQFKIQIQKFTYPAPDDFGQADLTDENQWSLHHAPFARILTRGGTSFSRALREEASAALILRVPYGSEVAAVKPQGFRIKYGTRTLQIEAAIDVDELHQEIEFACQERVEASA